MNSDGARMLSKRMNKWLTLSALYLASVSAALAAVYELPADGSAVVGTDSRVTVSSEDKLFDIARRYGIGYPEIVRANPKADIWKAGGTQEIHVAGPSYPAASAVRRNRGQSAGASAVLLPEA
jgi:LysM repeat protein